MRSQGSEVIQIEQDRIVYLININENISSIVGNNDADGDIIIPSSIIYQSKEYKTINILKDAFKQSYIKSIQFSPDSELQIIDEHAFEHHLLKAFNFHFTSPKSVDMLFITANIFRRLNSHQIQSFKQLMSVLFQDRQLRALHFHFTSP